jgi:hypothetical protein
VNFLQIDRRRPAVDIGERWFGGLAPILLPSHLVARPEDCRIGESTTPTVQILAAVIVL